MVSTIIERALANNFVLIAEMGVNYYDVGKKFGISPLNAAKLMIREAKKVGIHAVKFQSYKASTLAAKDSPSYWDIKEESTTSQYELFKKFDSFSNYEYQELAEYCQSVGIEFLSTAFDLNSADYLYDLMEVYKISSSDITNLPFIAYQAKKGKPIILSVGASSETEIDEAIRTIREFNDRPLALLHCILEYPTPFDHANLNRITTLKQKYPDVIIGYSDHTKPDPHADIIKTAYNLGAIMIEKHFTLDKTLTGNDHYHAMDPKDAKHIIQGIEFINTIRGSSDIKCLDSELISRRNARRSLVSCVNILPGVEIMPNMITSKRPGTGIPPSELSSLVGRIAKIQIPEDSILQYDMFEDEAIDR